MASITLARGSVRASLISVEVTVIFSGRPFNKFLPFISIVLSFSLGYAEPISIFIFSAVLSPISKLYFFLIKFIIERSNSSPATLTEREVTIPRSEITATSLVPPPISTIILPVGSATGRPAPIAAAIGSSTMNTLLAPAFSAASLTARFSTAVTPDGMHIITLAFVKNVPLRAFLINSCSRVVVMSNQQ